MMTFSLSLFATIYLSFMKFFLTDTFFFGFFIYEINTIHIPPQYIHVSYTVLLFSPSLLSFFFCILSFSFSFLDDDDESN